MRRPPFVALSGRLPHDAILLMEMSCRIRSTDESVLPPADILCKSFPCSIGEESREPASRLPACRDGAAIASREYKPRCRTMLDCPRWHVKRELSPRRATFEPPGVLLAIKGTWLRAKFPFSFGMVPKGGLEPPRVSPPPRKVRKVVQESGPPPQYVKKDNPRKQVCEKRA